MSEDALKVLVIDDVSSVRTLLCRLLKRAAQGETTRPIEFVEAGDGAQALDLVEEHEFDAIFLDLLMPRMDGFAFLEGFATLESSRRVPVIVCSGLTDVKALERAKELGACGLLPKPYDSEAVRHQWLAILRAYQSASPTVH